MSGTLSPPAVRGLPFARRTLVVVVLAVLVAAGGALWIAAPRAEETTDAAYVQADSSVLAPKVRGLVARVLAAHNQPVRRGDPLVQIDPEEFSARVAAAEADVQTAEAGQAEAQAALTALDAEERLSDSNVKVAGTAIRAAEAQNTRAGNDLRRFESLAASGAIAVRDLDAVRAGAASAASDQERARAALEASRDQAAVVRARRAGLMAAVEQARAARARASAALVLARQDLANTLVRAPVDGVVADRQVEPGDYVQPGTRLLTVAPLRALYVTANFKETQVARMLPGQRVAIRVDALPGKVLTGRVDSLAPGTGSQFSLLPFEPGTGNFTKIVQRVPVRIAFDPGQAEVVRLRPGLSVRATVRLRD